MIRLFLEINPYLVFLPLLIGLLHYRYLNAELKTVLGFVFLGSLTEIFADIYQIVWEQNTMPLGNVYIPLSVFVFSLFYLKTLRGFVNSKIIIGLIILYELFCVVNLIFIQNMYEFPNLPGAFGALLFLAFSILLFAKIMVEAKIERLFNEPVVWINTGVLIYYSAGFFYYALFNYSLQFSREFVYNTVIANAVANILFFVFITVGFWKAGRQKEVLTKDT